MDISPQRVRTAEFKTVKRGLDPDEVRAFLAEVATELERAQNQSTAMEARARAAVARLQELSDGSPAAPVPTSEPASPSGETAEASKSDVSTETASDVHPSVDESETISRTLLLAQRTADMTVAEAKAEAERIAREAGDEASKTLDSTREMSARLLDEAREEARREGDNERNAVRAEVDSLTARRDFLESDVDHLERHLADERSRVREAATSLIELTERVPGGMGEIRRPLLSAANDDEDVVEIAVGDPTPDAIVMPDGVDVDVDDGTDISVAGDDESGGLFIQTELDEAGPDGSSELSDPEH